MKATAKTPAASRPVLAVLCSGNGGNFQALAQAARARRLRAAIAVMITDNPEAGAIARAKRLGIESLVIRRSDYAGRAGYEKAMIEAMEARGVRWVCLAGYMRILSPLFIGHYRDRVVNVHPSLLPSFPGAHAVRDALAWGVRVTGVTIHLVEEAVDSGPILAQEAVAIRPRDTEESLLKRVHAVEHRLYAQTLQRFLSGKIAIRRRAAAQA